MRNKASRVAVQSVFKPAAQWLCLGLMVLPPVTAFADILRTENRLSLQSESFLSPDYSATTQKNFFFLGASFISRQPEPSASREGAVVQTEELSRPRVQVDLRGRFSPDAPVLSSFNLREIYFQQDTFAFGRRLLDWNTGDEEWNLGLFQPQYRWNVLKPHSQGLMGAFLSLGEGRGQGWNLTLFGSPFFVPDQGAGYVLQNGHFQRISPWFQTLPKEIRLSESNKVRNLQYQIEVPQLERIVLNSGYAARLDFSRSDSPSSGGVSFAYKPMNVLSLGMDGWAEADTDAPVIIEPTIVYHKLAAADYHWKTQPSVDLGWDVSLSEVLEHSEEPRDQKGNLTYTAYTPMSVTMASVAYKSPRWKMGLAWIQRRGGEARLLGDKAAELEKIVLPRLPFREAVALDLRGLVYSRGAQRVQMGARISEGINGSYSLFQSDVDWQVTRLWSLWADVILIRAQKQNGTNLDLFTTFENHDSLRAGVSYVF